MARALGSPARHKVADPLYVYVGLFTDLTSRPSRQTVLPHVFMRTQPVPSCHTQRPTRHTRVVAAGFWARPLEIL
jgi:hypothetical protein